MKVKRGFASDNNSGIHPQILRALQKVNRGHVVAYGDDPYTEKAIRELKSHFGEHINAYFVFNGTGANVVGLKAVTESFHSIICSEQAHLHEDECGAPEKYTGCKLLAIPTSDGKLTAEKIKPHLYGFGFEHHSQPRVISITQATELGTVYTPEEIRKLSDFAHRHGLLLHMDGARLANAAASLNCPLREITGDAGVDVLSFGGTKDGMMLGESVIFFNRELSRHFKYIRKQGMQLGSKMRFLSAQFLAWFENDLWLKNARHANEMAQYLAEKVRRVPQIQITQKVQANGVFAIVPKKYIPRLQKEFFFYVWDENTSEVRWMTSFDTTKQDVDQFVRLIRKVVT